MANTLALLGDSLGRRYVSRDELSSFVDGAEGSRVAFVSSLESDRISGAVLCEITSFQEFIESVPKSQMNSLATKLRQLEFHKIGIVKSIAVSQRHRRSGVATALVATGLDWLWRNGATAVVMIGWTDSNGCHIQGIAESFEFEAVAEIDDYWLEDSLLHDYDCPSCGQGCSCTAKIFLLRQ